MIDADRSDLDEADVAARVAEHARPLDPRGLADIVRGNLDMLAARAELLRARAPFAPRLPFAATARERSLRHYLASFGVECPPRTEGEHDKSAISLGHAFDKIMREKLRPSIVYVWSPAPDDGTTFAQAVRKLRGRHIEVRWLQPTIDLALPDGEHDAVKDAVYAAVKTRAEVAQQRGQRLLKRIGAKPAALRPATHGDPIQPAQRRLLASPDDLDDMPPSSAPPPSGAVR
jgi:hypothetical protein